MNLEAFRARISAVRAWFMEHTWALVFFGGVMALMSLLELPAVGRSIGLINLGETTPVTITSVFDIVEDEFVGSFAYVEGRSQRFPADKLYKKGDHAYLIYSDRIGYGVVTETPPKSALGLLFANAESRYPLGFTLVWVVILAFTNIGLILLAAVEYTIAPDVLDEIKGKTTRLSKISAAADTFIKALLAVGLCVLPIAAALAALSVSLKIQQASLVTIYVIYGALLIFFFSHVTAGAAIGLLKFFRSSFGRDLKAIIGSITALVVVVDILIKIVRLTFSRSVAELSSWWDVAKEFVHSVF